MAGHMHVKMTCSIEQDGIPVSLVEGASYDSDHPLVLARPELFEAEPEGRRRTPKVERATLAPGETRRGR